MDPRGVVRGFFSYAAKLAPPAIGANFYPFFFGWDGTLLK